MASVSSLHKITTSFWKTERQSLALPFCFYNKTTKSSSFHHQRSLKIDKKMLSLPYFEKFD
jgi:hypothetical protein